MAYRLDLHDGDASIRLLVQGSFRSFLDAIRGGQSVRSASNVLTCPDTGRPIGVVVHGDVHRAEPLLRRMFA